MANNQVKFTKSFQEGHWVIDAEMIAGDASSVLPMDVFTHENTGTATLGNYVGVCSLDELQRFQAWQGAVIRKFGNRYVRYRTANIQLDPGVDPDPVISVIRQNLSSLLKELTAAGQTSNVYDIT